jgi:hypothetical protein
MKKYFLLAIIIIIFILQSSCSIHSSVDSLNGIYSCSNTNVELNFISKTEVTQLTDPNTNYIIKWDYIIRNDSVIMTNTNPYFGQLSMILSIQDDNTLVLLNCMGIKSADEKNNIYKKKEINSK